MAAGYNSLTVTRTSTGVSWSFNATAMSSAYYFVQVRCEGASAGAEGLHQTASLPVTGSISASDPAFRTGKRVYTVTQYVRAGYSYDWAEEDSVTVTVTWPVAALRVKSGSTVKTCTNIRVKTGSTIKTVIGVYSVKNGTVKPGI